MNKKIGLDIGTVRIGIATSDLLGIIASSYEVYKRRNLAFDAKYVAELAKKLDADLDSETLKPLPEYTFNEYTATMIAGDTPTEAEC